MVAICNVMSVVSCSAKCKVIFSVGVRGSARLGGLDLVIGGGDT